MCCDYNIHRLPSIRLYGFVINWYLTLYHPIVHNWTTWYVVVELHGWTCKFSHQQHVHSLQHPVFPTRYGLQQTMKVLGRAPQTYTFPAILLPYILSGNINQGVRFCLSAPHSLLHTLLVCTWILPPLCAWEFCGEYQHLSLFLSIAAVLMLMTYTMSSRYVYERHHRAAWQARQIALHCAR